MKRLLFTGAVGNIGVPLLAVIRERYPDLEIRVADLKPPAESLKAEYIPTDFRLADVDYDRLVEGVDIVYHLGAETTPYDTHYQEVNVDATRKLAEAAERSGHVRYFVYTSTSLAYGYRPTRVIPDGQPLPPDPFVPDHDPLKAYSLSKYYSERELEKVASRVQYVVLRPVNVLSQQKFDTMVGEFSAKRRLWWSHRIWHGMASEDTAQALVGFMDEAVWRKLPPIAYFNFSADGFDFRTFDAIGYKMPPVIGGLLIGLLPYLDNAKDMLKYKYFRPVWNYTSTVFANDELKKLGLAPARYRYPGRK